MSYTCKICSNSLGNKSFQIRDNGEFHEKFTYFRCSFCGCLQILTIPSKIEKYYSNQYYSFKLNKTLISKNQLENFIKKLLYIIPFHRFRLLKQFMYEILNFFQDSLLKSLIYTNITKKSKILDVGCGSGSMLYMLKEFGYHNVLGIDPFISNTIKYNNGLIIKKVEFEQISGKWDLIMFHHSLEHMPNQQDVFQKISKLLNNKGICIIRIPTISSYAWRRYGINWIQIDPPRHFFIHSIKSINYLCSTHNLSLKRVIYDSNDFQFWGTEQSLRNIPLHSAHSHLKNKNSIFTHKEIKKFKKQARILNKKSQGDQAIFYACRR